MKRLRCESGPGRGVRRWVFLCLGLILASPGMANELTFTVTHLEQLQSYQAFDDVQLALLAQTPELNIRLNKLAGRIKRHTHPKTDHFLYCIAGHIELTVGAETRRIGAGDFVTIPRGSAHAMQRVGDAEALFLDVSSPADVGDVIWNE